MGISEGLTVATPSFQAWSMDASSAQVLLQEDSFLLPSVRGKEVRDYPPPLPAPHTRLPA